MAYGDHDVAATPKATGPAYIAENAGATTRQLANADIEALDSIDRRYRRFDPDSAPWEA
ncbi:MAG: hypothetical protein U5K28_10160 [Halobacteriales archaeon]|nr:hypothetical protein [Halobacteriales archaeon]